MCIMPYATMMIAPVLLFCLPLALRSYYGPYFLGYNSDPDYAYLLNSLNILNATPPGHTDHPGTTVQLLGAAGLLITWLGHLMTGGHLSMNEFVLRHPEESLGTINFVINVLVFSAVIFSSLSIYRTVQKIGPVLVFQLSLLVPLQIKLSLFRVNPEPLLVVTVLVLSGLLVRYQKSGSDARSWFKIPILAGMIMGFGTATKITFLPLMLLIALFPTNKERLLAVCGCVTSFLLFTLPIITKFPKMFSWFGSLATHKDNYGKGDVGLPAIAELMDNLLGLMQKEPFLFIFLACYVLYLVVKKYARQGVNNGDKKLLVLGAGVIIIQIIMTVKHPGVHYMLPAITLTALLNAVLVTTLKQNPRVFRTGLGNGLFYAVIFAGIVHGSYSTKSWAIESADYFKNETEQSNRINAVSGCSVISYYRASSIEYALSFGNEYSGFRYGKELSTMYPDALFYNIWSRMFHNYQIAVNPGVISNLLMRDRCVLMVGAPLDEGMRYNLLLTPIVESSRSAAYKLERFLF